MKDGKLGWIDWLHEFDVDDDDKSYEDHIKNGGSIEELMKRFPPDQPIDVKEWGMNDFREFFEGLASMCGEDFAWKMLFARIKERAGEGDGGLSLGKDGKFVV